METTKTKELMQMEMVADWIWANYDTNDLIDDMLDLMTMDFCEIEEFESYLHDCFVHGGASGCISGLVYHWEIKEWIYKYWDLVEGWLWDFEDKYGFEFKLNDWSKLAWAMYEDYAQELFNMIQDAKMSIEMEEE